MAVLTVIILCGCAVLYDSLGGAFRGEPTDMHGNLSEGAQQLLDDAFADIDPDALADMHVHLISRDIHESWLNPWRPIRHGRTHVYLSAAGVQMNDSLEVDYVQRLIDLIEAFPIRGKFYLYALDWHCCSEGRIAPDQTPLRVANEQMMNVVAQRPDLFVPVISIHPYRDDAVEQLERFADQGVRHVKWLPNAMGIDPSSEQCARFYEAIRQHEMVLLTHTGRESAIEATDQNLGNPLLLRKPLEMGVNVVALHSASDGIDIDHDDPSGQRVASFDLFMRLMDEPRYEGLLFGEASTMTFTRHLDRPLRTLLKRQDLHDRWVNGSDYPMCAVNAAISTSRLARLGFITREQARQLDEIYNYNPLLFDFVVKRTVRHPDSGDRLTADVFHVPTALR